MPQSKAAVKDKEAEVNLAEIEYDVNVVRGDKDNIGTRLIERRDALELKDHIDIDLGYEKIVKVDGEDVTLVLYIHTPGEIMAEAYYPVAEWRIMPDTLREADIWPQWKSFPLVLNGQEVRLPTGRRFQCKYYVWRSEQFMDEDQDGYFFFKPPFSTEMIRMSDIGIPVIKGEKLLELAAAKRLLGGQSTLAVAMRRSDE